MYLEESEISLSEIAIEESCLKSKDFELIEKQQLNPFVCSPEDGVFSLITPTGLRIVRKRQVVLFRYIKDEGRCRHNWEVVLDTLERFMLKPGCSSRDILTRFSGYGMCQVSQISIVNVYYIKSIEFKTRRCLLQSPFDQEEISISRANLYILRDSIESL